ncbi:hypothetical protein HanXRQr2_Chr15g0688641 [Helianthus annuus]|uniref:Uncharacterized protein n=1 Tax=Helianthus annuus TaxID=4232 RepID=A0A9K3DZZ2_HELAN|nr:hypothetical protein HanXRQr2_Chr15g0688641 [Helianthus annuus]
MKNGLCPTRNPYRKLEIAKVFGHLLPNTFHGHLGDHPPPNRPNSDRPNPIIRFEKRCRGAEATNSARLLRHLPPKHKLTIAEVALSRLSAITDPSPQKASKRCWALKPSLPHDVPLGKDLIHPSTQSDSTTRGDPEGKEAGMEGGGIHGSWVLSH